MHSRVERLRAPGSNAIVLRQEFRMTIDDNSAQLAPWEDEEFVDSPRVGRRDSDHYTDETWIRIVELPLNDLLSAIKRDVGKLSNIQLPRVRRDGFYLNQGVPTKAVDRNDVVRWNVPGERRSDESASGQLGRDDVLASLFGEVITSACRHFEIPLVRLTFELSWHRRWDARARLAKMYTVPPTGPAWPAVGAQLERGVRLHSP